MISSSIKVLQVNLNRSQLATESALQIAIKYKVDLIIVQEPWLVPSLDYNTAYLVAHPSYTQILPKDLRYRPRTLAYISKEFKPLVSLATSSPLDTDLLVLDVIQGNQRIQIVNIYQEKDQGGGELKTIQRSLTQLALYSHSLILGDFNTHHPRWDPLIKTRASSQDTSLIEWIEAQDLTLLNTPGVGTFFRPNMNRPSVLDLSLASSSIASRTTDWQVLPSLGSDHYGILLSIQGSAIPLVDNPLETSRFNTRLANWTDFELVLVEEVARSSSLGLATIQSIPTTSIDTLKEGATKSTKALETAAQELTDLIY
jgi:hypothetical protein